MTQSIIITSSFTGIASVKMAYSTNADMSGHSLTSAVAITANQLTKHTITGLADGTQYYYQPATAAGTLFGDIGKFITNPATAVLDMSIVLTSCQSSFGGAGHYDISEPTWHKINDLGPHHLIIQQGDFGYPGGTLHPGGTTGGHILKYQHVLAGFDLMRQALLESCSEIFCSDHQYSPDDGDSNAAGPYAAIVRTMIAAMIEMLPVAAGDWGDTRDPKQGLWRSWKPGAASNVLFIATDFRSLERSLQAMDDGPDKTAFGETQLEWFFGELARDDAVLKIFLNDLAWGPAAGWDDLTDHEKFDDKWWSYQAAQKVIADFINNNTTTAGDPIWVDYWGGDRHVLGWLSEDNNILGDGTQCPFDVVTASSSDKNGLYPVTGELYDEAFGFKPTPDATTNPRQFGHITLTDDGAGTITRTFDGWDCAPDPSILYTPQTYAPVKVIDGKVKTWSYDVGVYSPPVGSLLLTNADSSELAEILAVNTHFKDDGSQYRDGGNPDADVLDIVAEMGATVWRERFNNLSPQNQAIAALRPMKQFGQAGIDVNSNEAECRNMIHAVATGPRKDDAGSFTGSNEPNDRSGGASEWHDPDGTGRSMVEQVVFQQYTIWDQVMIEVAAGNWTATPGVPGGRPYVVGPGWKHEHVPLDDDIADLAAATYTTAGVTYHMADLCDRGDFHFYPGSNGSGNRMNGEDDNNDTPPGITFGADGKCAQEDFELRRFQRIYDLKLTGGTGALVSGHWKYTGGTVTSGHGVTMPMCHSEGGYQHTSGDGMTATEYQAYAALAGPETLLRDHALGIKMWAVYQAINNNANSPELGIYNQDAFPNGEYPIYTALNKVVSYSGSAPIDNVAWFEPLAGNDPDVTVYPFPKAGGGWDVYILWDGRTSCRFVLAPGHHVVGRARTSRDSFGNKRFDLTRPTELSRMTLLSVV